MLCRHCSEEITDIKEKSAVCPYCGKAQFEQNNDDTESSFIVSGKESVRVYSVLAAAVVVLIAAVISAANDFPLFIRRIPGKDFIGIWVGCSLLAIAAAIIAELIVCSWVSSKAAKSLGMTYSDSDLMLLQGFDRFRMSGYYLLKAKLHGIIKYYYIKKEDGTLTKDVLVKANSDKPQEEIDEYCRSNPQVRRIVDYIVRNEAIDGSRTTVQDVVYNVRPDPVIQSEGGRFVQSIIERKRTASDIIFWGAVYVCAYAAVTKLIMGLINQKPVENLVCAIIFSVLILIPLAILHTVIKNHVASGSLVKKIIRHKSAGYEQAGILFDHGKITNDELPPKEAATLLRSYVLYSYDPQKYTGVQAALPFAGAVFTSVVAAQAAQEAISKAMSRLDSGMSDTGNGGCSGCSGCGGGCGGCGGCGGD